MDLTYGQLGALSLAASACSAAPSKPPKPFYTGNFLKSCDRCEHAEPHYCKLYSRPMKNMDVKVCRDWLMRLNDPDERHAIERKI